MNRLLAAAIAATFSAAALLPVTAHAAASVGKAAPDFSLTDLNGKPAKLSDHKGKVVVLEWVNPNCPFVKKHYDSNNMQGLQKNWGGKQVVWLAINSTNPGHQDFLKNDQHSAWNKEKGVGSLATLTDADGKVGKLYEAKTTPHMYIVDTKGMLVYAGGIDDKRSANPADIKGAKNYVDVALAEVLAGKAVSTPTSTPYGCTVKY
jgi:hypothetical protein